MLTSGNPKTAKMDRNIYAEKIFYVNEPSIHINYWCFLNSGGFNYN